jgi:hypothetical protein
MGYQTRIYGVDLRRLQSAFGSHDGDLVRRLSEQYAEDFADADEGFATEIAEGALTLEAALAEVIQGTISGSRSTAFQYGYALEMLSRHLGEKMDTDMLGEIEGIGFAEQLATSGPPIPIPIPEDFPIIGYMTHQDAVAELQRIEGLDLSHPDRLVNIAIGQLRSCLEEARRQCLDLVAFCA